MPTPYRVPVYSLISDATDIELTVVYCSPREPNREWDMPPGRFQVKTLKPRILTLGENRFVHFNYDVWRALKALRPDVVITNGYNVTDLLAIAFCAVHRIPHISQTDGTVKSESILSPFHRAIRRAANRFTFGYVGPSQGSLELFRSFGALSGRTYWSPLAADNAALSSASYARDTDILFAGRLTEVKNPLFLLSVAQRTAEMLDRTVTVRIAGSGPLLSTIQGSLSRYPAVQIEIAGFVKRADLPRLYGEAKLFALPTTWDPWAVVANEALAAGTPVIASPHAGAADELIADHINGRVLELDVELWAAAAAELLDDADLWDRQSSAARASVLPYSFQAAADGFLRAIRDASAERRRHRGRRPRR